MDKPFQCRAVCHVCDKPVGYWYDMLYWPQPLLAHPHPVTIEYANPGGYEWHPKYELAAAF